MEIGMVRKSIQSTRKGQKDKSRKEKCSICHPYNTVISWIWEQLALTSGQNTTVSRLGNKVILQLMIGAWTGSVAISHSVTESSMELFYFLYQLEYSLFVTVTIHSIVMLTLNHISELTLIILETFDNEHNALHRVGTQQ